MFAGSPPHMRGKGITAIISRVETGITPAHAGKSPPGCTGACSTWDHPRTCGEKSARGWLLPFAQGSPPHMRGKASSSSMLCPPSGITPAHAGKRALEFPCPARPWDHPRTCGEKAQKITWTKRKPGSPPHMRGKVKLRALFNAQSGITPAHAGKRLRK